VYSIPGFDGRAGWGRDVRLLIEVADTSRAYDRWRKVPLYARAGIGEVWLVDLAGQRLEIHRRAAAAGYQDFRLPGRIETFAALAFPDIAVTLPDLML
jgi:Uma2 family endonuclease